LLFIKSRQKIGRTFKLNNVIGYTHNRLVKSTRNNHNSHTYNAKKQNRIFTSNS